MTKTRDKIEVHHQNLLIYADKIQKKRKAL